MLYRLLFIIAIMTPCLVQAEIRFGLGLETSFPTQASLGVSMRSTSGVIVFAGLGILPSRKKLASPFEVPISFFEQEALVHWDESHLLRKPGFLLFDKYASSSNRAGLYYLAKPFESSQQGRQNYPRRRDVYRRSLWRVSSPFGG